MTPGIYEFGPRQSVMAYGGRSGDIEQRWAQHRSMLRNDRHHCTYFQNAWNKYGEDVFEFIVLEVIEDPDLRLAAEQAWLDIHHANGTCYNIAITAGPAGPMAAGTKRKIGEAGIGNQRALGCTHSEEANRAKGERSKGNQYALGCTHSKEANIAKAKRMMGKLHPMWGKHLPAKTRSKLSKSLTGKQNSLGYKHTEEFGQAISRRLVGNQHALGSERTDEWRREKGEAMKLWWARKRAMAGLSLPVLIPNPSLPMLLYGGHRK